MVKNIILVTLLFGVVLLAFLLVRTYDISKDSREAIDQERYHRMVAEKDLQEAQQAMKKLEIEFETVQGKLTEKELMLQKEQALVADLRDQVSSLEKTKGELETQMRELLTTGKTLTQ